MWNSEIQLQKIYRSVRNDDQHDEVEQALNDLLNSPNSLERDVSNLGANTGASIAGSMNADEMRDALRQTSSFTPIRSGFAATHFFR